MSDSALEAGRAFAETRMVDRWVVEEITSGGVLNEESGEYEGAVVRVYPPVESADEHGPGKFRAANTAVGNVEAAGQLLIEQGATLSLPVATSVGVREGHMARCVAAANDPGMVGVRVRVDGPSHGTATTARRFRVTEVNDGR